MKELLPRLSYDHPVSVLMMFLASMVVGIIAWSRISVQMMPDGFEPAFLYVGMDYFNASPAEVDEKVVRIVEAELATVPGLSRMESDAEMGEAGFSLEFHSSVDMDVTYNTVVDRIERAMPDLPTEVERYFVYKFNPNDQPVIWLGASLPPTVEDPYEVLQRVVLPRLERLPGVAAVDLWGAPQTIMRIDYDREKLFAYGINLGELQGRISRDNLQMSGGEIEDRGEKRLVRSLARFEGPEAYTSYPVKGDLRLRDIAWVGMGKPLESSIQRINGQTAAAMGVRKDANANTVDVAKSIRETLEALEADPRVQGAKFHVFFDQGELIQESMDELGKSALEGGLFAVFILFVFLREWRMTALIALSIPFSLLLTVGVMYFIGDTLNLLALMGLMLSVGMVVDNVIVVVEVIYGHRGQGANARDAAIEGTAEVVLPITLSTMTSSVVFLPVILMSGNAAIGFFMGVLGRPVIIAHVASLVVALIFAPLATRYIGATHIREDPRWLKWLSGLYRRTLVRTLRHPADSAMAMAALMLLTFTVAIPGIQCSTSDEGNLNDFVVRFDLPPQASLPERDEIAKKFEAVVAAHKEEWGVRVYRIRLGADDAMGRLNITLVDDGPMDREAVMEAAKEKLPNDIPGVGIALGWEGQTGGSEQTLALSVYGEDMPLLYALSGEVARRLVGTPGIIDVHEDVENQGADEIRLAPDSAALERYGLSPQDVGQTVAFAMRGTRLPPLISGRREIPVQTVIALEDRETLGALLDFGLWSPTKQQVVPVRAVTDHTIGKSPQSIHRLDSRTSLGITLDLAPDANIMTVLPEIEARLADMAFPRGYGWTDGDASMKQQEEDAALGFALLLSVTFVFLIMGMLFESFVLPLAVITTVPMAMFGAVWFLWATSTPMDTMAGVGLVILVGIIVNNGIVLVDHISILRHEGMPREEALLEAGTRRLRPILMTALTAICGLIPMAFGSSGFIGIPYAPLGRAVLGGLVAGTVLTLLFVPICYAWLDDWREGAGRAFRVARGT
jgi:HAE1 family hydrophobic/amphiphilic exporter-1